MIESVVDGGQEVRGRKTKEIRRSTSGAAKRTVKAPRSGKSRRRQSRRSRRGAAEEPARGGIAVGFDSRAETRERNPG